MSARDDGGPAFPSEAVYNGPGETLRPPYSGMSLRQWYAGKALAGICEIESDRHTAARRAVAYADAMLAELAK